jgi:hypothetical protein
VRYAKWLVVAVAAVAAFVGIRHWPRHWVHASCGYCVEARFGSLPPDDEPLREWLRAQPGVVPDTVSVRRFGRGGRRLEIVFIHVRNLAGEPPLPDLNARCAGVGYAKPDAPFRDCEDLDR